MADFPHVFRHSIAVHLLNAGWDLIDVQHWLGHASIASTQIYAKVSNIRIDTKFRALRSTEIAAL
ncbi:MAG: tyrosine-type recombinase/integrase [Thermoanaerobaculia bacterium]